MRIFLLSLPMLLAAPMSFAQGILPASVADWNSTPAVLTGGAPQATQVLEEDGLKATEQRMYTRGADRFNATLYVFGDTEGAYSAYSFLRTPDMPQANITQHSSMSKGRVLALTGNFVLDFYNVKDQQKDSDAIELIVAEAGGRAHWGPYPALPQRLPTERFIPRTDHFILGPVALAQFFPQLKGDSFEFPKGTEAEIGQYRFASHDATLLILYYPTPQIATSELQRLQGAGAVTSGNPEANENRRTTSAPIYVHQDSMMITLVADAPSAETASSLLSQVHPGLVLTWNTEVIEKPQPTMVTIVIGTFVGAGEICAFTLLGGLLFAGLRLLIKRLWPGRVFDRALDMEIIELGLASRPVKGNDLYQMRRQT